MGGEIEIKGRGLSKAFPGHWESAGNRRTRALCPSGEAGPSNKDWGVRNRGGSLVQEGRAGVVYTVPCTEP